MLAPQLQQTRYDGINNRIEQKRVRKTEIVNHTAAKSEQAGIQKTEFTNCQHHGTEAKIRYEQQIVNQIAVGKNHGKYFIDQKADDDKDDMRNAYSSPFSTMTLTIENV